jgi:hypothetical protein
MSSIQDNRTCFSGGEPDWWNNACLGWLADASGTYIRGYKSAADRLLESLAEDRLQLDAIIYPAVFLYRHYIELSLKHIVREGSILLKGAPPLKDHDLNKQWWAARGILEKLWPESDRGPLDEAERVIRQFSAVDPRSTAFRYADGTKSLTKVRHINIRVLYEEVAKLAVVLDGANSGIDAYVSALDERA